MGVKSHYFNKNWLRPFSWLFSLYINHLWCPTAFHSGSCPVRWCCIYSHRLCMLLEVRLQEGYSLLAWAVWPSLHWQHVWPYHNLFLSLWDMFFVYLFCFIFFSAQWSHGTLSNRNLTWNISGNDQSKLVAIVYF